MRSQQPTDSYIGRLRLDALASETIVIPDTHLFDGTFFTRITPTELLEKVGRGITTPAFPIEIRAREASLDLSLRSFFLKAKGGLINMWPLNVIPDREDGLVLAEELHERGSDALTRALSRGGSAPKALSAFLKDVLTGRSSAIHAIELAAEGWAKWIEAEQEGLVRVVPWEGSYPLSAALALDPLDEEDLTSFGRRTYHQVMRVVSKSTDRADLRPVFDDAETNAVSDQELLDVEIIQRWCSLGRHRAIAHQHDANYEHVESVGYIPVGPIHRLSDRLAEGHRPARFKDVEVHVPPDLTTSLALMDDSAYRGLFTRAHEDLQRWWASADTGGLRRVVDMVAKDLPRPNHPSPSVAKVCWVGAGASATAYLSSAVDPVAGGAVGAVIALIVDSVVPRDSTTLEKSIIEYCVDRIERP